MISRQPPFLRTSRFETSCLIKLSTVARRMYLYGERVRNFISLRDKKSSDMISGVQKSGTEVLSYEIGQMWKF